MNNAKILEKIIDVSPVTKRWGRGWGIFVYAFLILGLISLSFIPRNSGSTGRVSFAVVERGDFYIDLVETGDVEAQTQHLISAPMMWSAKLQVVELIEEGAVVQKGDFLLRFDASDLQTEYDLAVDNLNSLKADLNKLDAQQKLTIQNMENQLTLSRYSFEQAELRLQMQEFESEARKKESKLQLKQAEIDLKRVEKQLESQKIINHSQRLKTALSVKQSEYRVHTLEERMQKLILTAPDAGMVVYVNQYDDRLKEGFEARPGRALLSIPDLSRIRIKSYINEVDRQKVAEGQTVKIRLEAYPDIEYNGFISDVSNLAQQVQRDSELKGFIVLVDINLPEPDLRLKPGMTAVISILEEEKRDVLTVPLGALFEKEGNPVVCPYKKRSTIAVEILARNDSRAVIRGNLKEGQKLSWEPPSEDIHVLGLREEQRRVSLLKERILHSFSVFKERGILYDYLGNEAGSADSASSGTETAFDISTLPPSLRARLERDNKTQNSGKPTSKAGEPGDKTGTQKLIVSPEMIKRLQK